MAEPPSDTVAILLPQLSDPSMLLRLLLKSALLPPLAQLLLIGGGIFLLKRSPRLSQLCFALGMVSLYLLSTPWVSSALYTGLEKVPHIQPHRLASIDAGAIVVLTSWQNEYTPEFGRPVTGLVGLSRVRYGAYLHNQTALPVLVSGGNVYGDSHHSLAATMAADFRSGFNVEPTWLEEKSRTTEENAIYSAEILKAEGIDHILLVSSAYHLKRAQLVFEAQGLRVTAAPTFFVSKLPTSVRSFIPSAIALEGSATAMHEWLGYLYYQLMR